MARCRSRYFGILTEQKILFLIVFILLIFAVWFTFPIIKTSKGQYIARKEKRPLGCYCRPNKSNPRQRHRQRRAERLGRIDFGKPIPAKRTPMATERQDGEEINLDRNP